MDLCKICRAKAVEVFLDLGKQPLCNRFLTSSFQDEYVHPMEIGQCGVCGLVQIPNPVPAEELRLRYDWIAYREPDRHLDELADTLSRLPGITKESTICGIDLKFKDGPLLERMKMQGFQKIRWTDSQQDHQIPGASDIVIARHSLEHAQDVFDFAEGLHQLMAPGAYVVIEVPDGKKAMESRDYASLWEEHVLYFTPETFHHSFSFLGLSLFDFKTYPYRLEDNLVGIGRIEGAVKTSLPTREVLEREKQRAQGYGQGFEKTRGTFKKFLEEFRRTQGDIALLGAGHRACMLINLLELKESIKFVADDDPHKQGLRMPGSCLPIYPSSALLKEKVKLCLLCIDPKNETRVIEKNRAFLELGGSFLSSSPDSPYRLPTFGQLSGQERYAKT